MVSSLTFLDTYPNDLEFKLPQTLKNWSRAEYEANKATLLARRAAHLAARNRFQVPWGLTNALAPEMGNLVNCNSRLIETITLPITIGNWHYSRSGVIGSVVDLITEPRKNTYNYF
jgi:hypothetical protein